MQRIEYQTIFSIAVEHAYYAEGIGPGFDWEPVAQTRTWLSAHRMLIRNTTDGFRLLGDRSALPASIDSVTQPLVWCFYSRDAHFESVTDQAPSARQSLYLFAPSPGAKPKDPPVRLHAGPKASSQDWVGIGSGEVSQWFDPATEPRIPTGVVSVPVPDATSPFSEHQYRIAFGARATYWRYYLVGAWPTEGLSIVDPAGKIQFGPFKEQLLESGQLALACRSTSTITLQERSQIQLQLHEGHGDAASILIRRLPVADAQYFARETIDQKPALVSELYVHR